MCSRPEREVDNNHYEVDEDEAEGGGAEVDALHDPPEPPAEILLVGASGRRFAGVRPGVRDHVRGLVPADRVVLVVVNKEPGGSLKHLICRVASSLLQRNLRVPSDQIEIYPKYTNLIANSLETSVCTPY